MILSRKETLKLHNAVGWLVFCMVRVAFFNALRNVTA